MPTVGIKCDLLFKALGRVYTEDEFNDLCFEFGLELDEVTTEKQIVSKEQGSERSEGLSEEIIYRIDIPANRYDLLCLEGLVRALLIFQKKIEIPVYRTICPSDRRMHQLLILPNTRQVRPYAVAAILRNITFTKDTYNSFIDLQDKLHQNICRRRTLAAIGTHDLDTIKGPFIFDAKVPNDIKFKPLNQTKEISAPELMDLYSNDSHLKPYLPIIRDKPVYPVIYDQDGVVLSMPPIINGEHSKITLNTRNVFVEVTATDLNKAKMVLDTLVCMFSQYCNVPFEIESVEVIQSDTSTAIYPELKYREEHVSVDYINRNLGLSLTSDEVANYLTKMTLKSKALDNDTVEVVIPPTRHDVLHACDIMEDVGISYGYNNITMTFPNVGTVGEQTYLNKLTDQLRHEIARCGYTEVLTFSLCSVEDINEKLRKNDALYKAVHVANPKTVEFEVARISLLPGVLKTIQSNKKMPLPLKLFEISDVVLKDENTDVGARNERRLCAVNYNKYPGFEIIHGVLDRIMQVLEIPYSPTKSDVGYYIEAFNDETYLTGRCARVIIDGKQRGLMGVIHPDVVTNFDLTQPCAALELSIQDM